MMSKTKSLAVAKRVGETGNYVFVTLAEQARRFEQATGQKVLDLSAGNPTLSPPVELMVGLGELALEPVNFRYAGYGACPEFLQALTTHYERWSGVVLEKHQILPLAGAKDGINALILALTNPGDEILVPNPGYPAYRGLAKLYGVGVVPYSDLSEVTKLATPKTKAIWVNFPSNPTGEVVVRATLENLVEWCRQQKIWLLFDHAYAGIAFDSKVTTSILEIPRAIEVAVEIGSLSKSHSLAGLRIGWAVGNTKAIAALKQIKSQLDSGVSLLLQKLAARALIQTGDTWHTRLLTHYDRSRHLVGELLRGLGLKANLPQAALYFWVEVPTTFKNGEALANHLLTKWGVLVTPGSAFGLAGQRYIRVSLTADLVQLEQKIKEVNEINNQ